MTSDSGWEIFETDIFKKYFISSFLWENKTNKTKNIEIRGLCKLQVTVVSVKIFSRFFSCPAPSCLVYVCQVRAGSSSLRETFSRWNPCYAHRKHQCKRLHKIASSNAHKWATFLPILCLDKCDIFGEKNAARSENDNCSWSLFFNQKFLNFDERFAWIFFKLWDSMAFFFQKNFSNWILFTQWNSPRNRPSWCWKSATHQRVVVAPLTRIFFFHHWVLFQAINALQLLRRVLIFFCLSPGPHNDIYRFWLHKIMNSFHTEETNSVRWWQWTRNELVLQDSRVSLIHMFPSCYRSIYLFPRRETGVDPEFWCRGWGMKTKFQLQFFHWPQPFCCKPQTTTHHWVNSIFRSERSGVVWNSHWTWNWEISKKKKLGNWNFCKNEEKKHLRFSEKVCKNPREFFGGSWFPQENYTHVA